MDSSAHGSYRRVITKPDQVDFSIVEMQNENEDLLSADYLVNEDPVPKVVHGEDNVYGPVTKALRVRFNLKTSSYATMFLREITRTSSAFSA